MNEIILDYLPIEPYFYEDLLSVKDISSLSKWAYLLDGAWFLAGQIFNVGNANFSSDYPLLGFARNLRAVSCHLARNPKEAYCYFDEAGWEINRQLIYFGDGEEVLIRQGTLIGESRILASARVSLHELEVKSTEYLSRVFDHCCSLVPHLRHSDSMQQWLNDLTHVSTLESELINADRTKDLYQRP